VSSFRLVSATVGLVLTVAQPVAADLLPPGDADVCLEIASSAISTEEWAALGSPVTEAVGARTAMFPSPRFDSAGNRLTISSGHAGLASGHDGCLEGGHEWTSRFDRDFLEAGAELMLAEAPTTPGIDSAVTIEWHPQESRLRTTLEFAGPFDIPNGTCWIDDVLAVADGIVTTTGEQGVRTSPFAESACGRFFEHLPQGGAGEQAVTLLPMTIELPDGGQLRFVAEEVSVQEDALVVAGSLARD
jgi:hypothetical protein